MKISSFVCTGLLALVLMPFCLPLTLSAAPDRESSIKLPATDLKKDSKKPKKYAAIQHEDIAAPISDEMKDPIPLPPPVLKIPMLAQIPRIPKDSLPVKVDEHLRMANEVARINQQLDRIVSLNQSLQIKHIDQSREIARITEQAKIHQKVLHNVRAAKLEEDAIAREKIKIIKQETDESESFIEHLESNSNEDGFNTPAQ